MSDAINPKHYDFGNVQPVDIAEHLSFNLGNVVKYASRAGRKGDAMEDLRKAQWYLDREIQLISAYHEDRKRRNARAAEHLRKVLLAEETDD